MTNSAHLVLAQTAAHALAERIIDEGLYEGTAARYRLPDGRIVKVKVWHDPDNDPFADDWLGSVYWPHRYDEGQRPSECDGAAHKLQTRSGPIWWQPPADINNANDPAVIEELKKLAQGWFHDDWTYVGITTTIGDAAHHIGGIDTLNECEHIEEIIHDSIIECLYDDASECCPTCGQNIVNLNTKEHA